MKMARLTLKSTKLLGVSGELVAEAGTKGEKSYTFGYLYKGEGSPGANANFQFKTACLRQKNNSA
ncbi:hypothetical protein [Paenibacillus ehimensis]|uniref:Uncharacterized protein n=1 Tax=Paenibacillus ehimensis TaxID=79264 RepID=A0ABT8V9M9_9BACL|nr:hypothetical protein [Paenibacillus ehimensis]MDO3677061.1 hypothetical protein [Paenibacillus ehimensis]